MVSLKGPSGNTWHASLVLDSIGFYFTHGWNEFLIDHNINLGDVLVFRYDGQSQFSVRIFDTTACKKPSAFLARPFKDVNEEGEKQPMGIDIDNVLQCSHEGYMGHNPIGGLHENMDDVSKYETNTLESKDQGGDIDVCDTLQQGEREDMDIETHDAADALLHLMPQQIEKTRNVDDIYRGNIS